MAELCFAVGAGVLFVVDGRVMMIRAVVGGMRKLCDGVEVFGDDGFWMESVCPGLGSQA